MKKHTGDYTTQGQGHPNSMDSQNPQRRDTSEASSFQQGHCHLCSSYKVGQDSQTSGGKVHTSCQEYQGLCSTPKGHQVTTRWVYTFLSCKGTFHLSANNIWHQYHQRPADQRPGTPPQNIHDSWTNHLPIGFCLKNTYFVFQGMYYELLEGAAMGSPISSIVVNLYMEAFETKALNTSPDTLVCEKDM